MPEIEGNHPIHASQETYAVREARIGSIENAKQHIVDHLNGHDLGTPRMDYFTDSVDLYVARRKEDRSDIEIAMIKETMRQRANSVKGYLEEQEQGQLDNLLDDYWFMVREKSMRDRTGNDPQVDYSKGLQEIKLQELRKRQPPQTPSQQ